MIWHTLGIELRSQNSNPTFETIRPRTHERLRITSKLDARVLSVIKSPQEVQLIQKKKEQYFIQTNFLKCCWVRPYKKCAQSLRHATVDGINRHYKKCPQSLRHATVESINMIKLSTIMPVLVFVCVRFTALSHFNYSCAVQNYIPLYLILPWVSDTLYAHNVVLTSKQHS